MADKTPKKTETKMRTSWNDMSVPKFNKKYGTEYSSKEDLKVGVPFKKDSADLKNAVKDYKSGEIMYPKKTPISLATSGSSVYEPDVRKKNMVKTGLKMMKASNTASKIMERRGNDKEFFTKMKGKK